MPTATATATATATEPHLCARWWARHRRRLIVVEVARAPSPVRVLEADAGAAARWLPYSLADAGGRWLEALELALRSELGLAPGARVTAPYGDGAHTADRYERVTWGWAGRADGQPNDALARLWGAEELADLSPHDDALRATALYAPVVARDGEISLRHGAEAWVLVEPPGADALIYSGPHAEHAEAEEAYREALGYRAAPELGDRGDGWEERDDEDADAGGAP